MDVNVRYVFLLLIVLTLFISEGRYFAEATSYYEIRNKSVTLNGEVRLDCLPDPRYNQYDKDKYSEFIWYTGPKNPSKNSLDRSLRQPIIIVTQSMNSRAGENALVSNYARKFPNELWYHYTVEINRYSKSHGNLIIRHANRDVEGLYGCTYGASNIESPVSYYVTVVQTAANNKLTDLSITLLASNGITILTVCLLQCLFYSRLQ